MDSKNNMIFNLYILGCSECTTLFEVVFVCNILILIFSGVVNILLCERLRRRKCELCAGEVHFNFVT